MSCRYEMLVVDLDGTLLRSDGTVSSADYQALQDARNADLEVVIATGRSARESRQIIERIQFDGTMIASGGSVLCDARTGLTRQRLGIDHDIAWPIVEDLTAHGHKALVLKDADVTGYDYLTVGSAPLHPASAWWFEAMQVRVREYADDGPHPHPEHSLRVGAVATEEQLAPIAIRLLEAYADRCHVQHWSAVTATEATGSSVHLLEVFGPSVDKWTMLESYCSQRSIPVESVVAIGDGLNDVQMVERAGLGIGLANADERVKKVADRIAGHHDHDGVASAVRAVLDGQW